MCVCVCVPDTYSGRQGLCLYVVLEHALSWAYKFKKNKHSLWLEKLEKVVPIEYMS